MHTHGVRLLQEYLGQEKEHLTRAKRAHDIVPVLAARKGTSATKGAASASSAKGTHASAAQPHLSARVIAYLQAKHAEAGATNKLSSGQLRFACQVASIGAADSAPGHEDQKMLVRRLQVGGVPSMADTLAITCLQRADTAYRTAVAACGSLEAAAAVTCGSAEGGSLLVFSEDATLAAALRTELVSRYGIEVLFLVGSNAVRHPTFPLLPPTGRSRSISPPPSKAKSNARKKTSAAAEKKAEGEALKAEDETEAAAPLRAAVVITTVEDFLAVDKRSAIWKFVGVYAVALRHPSRNSALLKQLVQTVSSSSKKKAESGENKAKQDEPLSRRVSEHRWACLGHCGVACVLATDKAALGAPELDWLTTLRPTESNSATAAASSSSSSTKTTLALQTREEVVVRYAVSEGVSRFQFLYGLVNGLDANRGLVIHVATKETCTFLYDVLYSFIDDLPQHIQFFTDYEGESQFSALATTAARQRVCDAFDATVMTSPAAAASSSTSSPTRMEKTAAVLISCYGLVPARGTIFLHYDVIPDLPNFNQFICDSLTPAAQVSGSGVERDNTVRSRKRSVSPTPRKAAKKSPAATAHGTKEKPSEEKKSFYRFIFLLFRPNEVAGALSHLRSTATRHALTYTEMPQRATETRYMLVGAKLKSMNKKLFAIQNAAYYAYKATMTVYCTVGPRNVYDEKKVDLNKVAEEFGYTDLPLLDLRLKDTVFRPKEDFFKAAKQKQSRERRAYKQFVKDSIIGEMPEEHVADV